MLILKALGKGETWFVSSAVYLIHNAFYIFQSVFVLKHDTALQWLKSQWNSCLSNFYKIEHIMHQLLATLLLPIQRVSRMPVSKIRVWWFPSTSDQVKEFLVEYVLAVLNWVFTTHLTLWEYWLEVYTHLVPSKSRPEKYYKQMNNTNRK